jgi:uncharacterized protein YprB with RNaseH-like and TPR domain
MSGVGPWLESTLWDAGVRTWDDLPAASPRALSPRLRPRLEAAVARARQALEAGDAEALAAMLPRAERWRLYPEFLAQASFLDVETDGDRLTAVGFLDAAGPRILLAGRDLDEFPERAAGWKLLVTYNGLAFDVPALRAAFPGWRAPVAHVDLCPLWRRMGHAGGLKLLERSEGLHRPPHLDGLSGADAVRLWHRHLDGDPAALRLFAEYNLLDAVHLRTLADRGYNRMVERLRLPAHPLPVSEPGDVRYDVTRALLAL